MTNHRKGQTYDHYLSPRTKYDRVKDDTQNYRPAERRRRKTKSDIIRRCNRLDN